MKKVFSTLVRSWTPPALAPFLRQINPGSSSFKGGVNTWEQAQSLCTGYDSGNILAKVLETSLKVKRGEGKFERDSVLFNHTEYCWPVLSSLMWVAAQNSGRLEVLDFGGALGSGYFQNKEFLNKIPFVRWHIVEQAHFVESGREHLEDKQLRFHRSISDCLGQNQPDIILLSSVLQYIKEPVELLRQLAESQIPYLVIDRTPFSLSSQDKLVIQSVPRTIYQASYPMWIFSSQKFKTLLEKYWDIISPFESLGSSVALNTRFKFSFQGMVLKRKDHKTCKKPSGQIEDTML